MLFLRTPLVLALLALAASCQCRPPTLGHAGDGELRVEPASLSFPTTYVTFQTELTLEVSNVGEGPIAEIAGVESPFTSETSRTN